MSLIADGLLIATCLTTALYCLVLSRRLRRLSDTDEGIGQQILRLNTALAETRAAVGEIRASSRAASEQLEQDIEAARRQSQQLQLQIARALKSGVGTRDDPHTPATPDPVHDVDPGWDDDLPDRALVAADAERAEAAVAPVVDFDAADPVEDALDADLRAADVPAHDTDAYEDAGMLADRVGDETGLSGDDAAELEDHWPFDEADPDDDASRGSVGAGGAEGVGSIDDAAEQISSRGRQPGRGRRQATHEDGDAGLLRVERMAV